MIKLLSSKHFINSYFAVNKICCRRNCIQLIAKYSSINNNKINSNSFNLKNNWLKSMKLKTIPSFNNYVNKRLLTTLDVKEMSICVTVSQMKRFLFNNKISLKEGPTCIRIECPFCQLKKGQSSLYINKTNCTYICFSCQQTGTWTTFVELISSLHLNAKMKKTCGIQLPQIDNKLFPDEKVMKQVMDVYNSGVPFNELNETQLKLVLNQFKLNGLSGESLHAFGVRVSHDLKTLMFPFDAWGKHKIVGLKLIESKGDSGKESSRDFHEKLIPSDIPLGVFGLNKINPSCEEIVICETAKDAIAINQETGLASIAFPSHVELAHLRPEALPCLETFKKITIWFGNSVQNWNSAKIIARKLDEKRCYLVNTNEALTATPLIALNNKSKLTKYLHSAQKMSHEAITTFRALRHAILAELKDPQCSGILWSRFPELNKHLKGHRCGELTVFTGSTGCGKTTFMSEYSLDLCMNGVRTLWGSFEVKNVRLAKMMLTQFAEKSVQQHIEEFDMWADRFEQLPLYFMTFHGQESIKNVLSAMKHAVYVHDIRHIIVDNIQFMLGCDSSQFDRFWQQDLVLDSFRKFATREDCHVTLVIHPRKEENMDELNNNSIFGGAKASQEADNILILQNKWLSTYKCPKYIQITKNRWDGDLGKVPLWFDKESLSYSPTSRRSTQMTLSNTFDDETIGTQDRVSSKCSDSEMRVALNATVKCDSEQDFDHLRLQ